MSKDFVQISADVASGVGLLRQAVPEAMKAFGSLSMAVTASKAIDSKTKELMAVAIGVAIHCDGCRVSYQDGASTQRNSRRGR